MSDTSNKKDTLIDAMTQISGGAAPSPGAGKPGGKFLQPKITGDKILDERTNKAWAELTANSYELINKLFNETFDTYMAEFKKVAWLYRVLFWVGLVLFLAAVGIGVITREPWITLIFAGMGTTLFLAFFISQPLRALEENQQMLVWLGGTYSTYITRLAAISESENALEQYKQAGADFHQNMAELVEKSAALRAARPGADPSRSNAG